MGILDTDSASKKKRTKKPIDEEPKAKSVESQSLWSTIRSTLQTELSQEDYNTWIAPLEVTIRGPNELVIAAPNVVFSEGIQASFLDRIEQLKMELGYDDHLIRLEIQGPLPDNLAKIRDLYSDQNFESTAITELESQSPLLPYSTPHPSGQPEFGLNPNYTFDSFVQGDSNQFAVGACSNAAALPGQSYNPLFVYGSTGLGKTHLLHAVGNLIKAKNPHFHIMYLSSERFMNEMIYCLRFAKMWEFRQKYRSCDVLLLDDIQFISGKRSTQEEFFHTFNALYAEKKQIVITSDMFPKEIPDIEDRLRYRFEWGLIADIQPPSIEHRIEILFKKARDMGFPMSTDIAEYLAKHSRRNVRELEGALHRVQAFARLQNSPITMQLVSQAFQDVAAVEPSKQLTIETVQKFVAEHFDVSVADLKSKRRLKTLSYPRQVAMYLTRKATGASFPEIGVKFGGKDHTTVMHNVKKIEELIPYDLELRSTIQVLERKLEGLSL